MAIGSNVFGEFNPQEIYDLMNRQRYEMERRSALGMMGQGLAPQQFGACSNPNVAPPQEPQPNPVLLLLESV